MGDGGAAVDPHYCVVLRSNTPESSISGVQNASQAVVGRHVAIAPAKRQWYDRQSSCALELDVAADSILNPAIFRSLQNSLEASEQLHVVPSLAAIWEVRACACQALIRLLQRV